MCSLLTLAQPQGLVWDKEDGSKWMISILGILVISILDVFKPWSCLTVQGWPRVLQGPFQPMSLVPAASAEPSSAVTPQRDSTRAQICLVVGVEGPEVPFHLPHWPPNPATALWATPGRCNRGVRFLAILRNTQKYLISPPPLRLRLFNSAPDLDIDLWRPGPGSGCFQIDPNLLCY